VDRPDGGHVSGAIGRQGDTAEATSGRLGVMLSKCLREEPFAESLYRLCTRLSGTRAALPDMFWRVAAGHSAMPREGSQRGGTSAQAKCAPRGAQTMVEDIYVPPERRRLVSWARAEVPRRSLYGSCDAGGVAAAGVGIGLDGARQTRKNTVSESDRSAGNEYNWPFCRRQRSGL